MTLSEIADQQTTEAQAEALPPLERCLRIALLVDLLREERELFEATASAVHLSRAWSPLIQAFRDVSDYLSVTRSIPPEDLAAYAHIMGAPESGLPDSGATLGECLTTHFLKEPLQ